MRQDRHGLKVMVQYSHFCLDHLGHQLVLAFGNLDHLLNQPSADPVLQLGYAGLVSGCAAGIAGPYIRLDGI